MYYIPFNSRLSYHKSEYGAVPAGKELTLRIILPRSLGCSRALLAVAPFGGEAHEKEMFWSGMEGENEEWWSITLSYPETGIYHYSFRCETPSGDVFITRRESSLGSFEGDGTPWQQTVYSPSLRTPSWIKGGVMYQIFPDRFCFSGKKKKGVPADRILRDDWGNEPLWELDENEKVTKYDFFQGDLKGIEQRLSYLSGLGVNCIYLNPVFLAHSNHRYDTADYLKIDPLLGNEEDFARLCRNAEKKGIRIILDGVFSHTGSDSVYFNRENNYPVTGAYNSPGSEYYPWYSFEEYPDKYSCWWGVDILPQVNEADPSYLEFITGENGVLRKWLSLGASGWRLDVADELPDIFLDRLNTCVKGADEENYIVGEVWEDASNKVAYGSLRRYLLGGQLDGVMNYPFASALVSFAASGKAEGFNESIMEITENYPAPCLHALMNHIGTHDTCRIITRLAVGDSIPHNHKNRFRGRLTGEQKEYGTALLKLISVMQFTLPGVPCIYYGDEAGLTGGDDPFNRGCYPWGNEDEGLIEHYRALGEMRKNHPVFGTGAFLPVSDTLSCVAYERKGCGERAMTIANRNAEDIGYVLREGGWCFDGGKPVEGNSVRVPALSALVIFRKESEDIG